MYVTIAINHEDGMGGLEIDTIECKQVNYRKLKFKNMLDELFTRLTNRFANEIVYHGREGLPEDNDTPFNAVVLNVCDKINTRHSESIEKSMHIIAGNAVVTINNNSGELIGRITNKD